MKTKNVYILLGIFAFLSLLGIGCGPSDGGDEAGEGIVYDSLPIFEKDTFQYPIAMRSSSYMFPEDFFGDVKIIDGDFASPWQTIPGLVTGEYIEFDFDSMYISGFEIFVPKEIRYSKIKNIKVYAEGKLLGTFITEMRIPIGRKVNTFRIEIGETDGLNKVDIPFQNDSTQNIETNALSTESIYASKAAAITEVVFFDQKGKGIPLRSLQVKKAKMNFYGTAEPQQMNNARLLFDGRKAFGWKGLADAKDKTLLFSFNQDQVINGLYFPFTQNLNITKIGFRLRKRSLPEYEIKPGPGNGVFITLKNTLKGKNFELVILETKNNEAPTIPELLFHDGSRLFSIYSDSLQVYQKQRLDSSKNNPVGHYIDSRVVARSGYKHYTQPLNVIYAKKKTVKDTLPEKITENETVFRLCSNGTFILTETHKENKLGPESSVYTQVKAAEGYWVMKSKSPDEAKITCYTDLKESNIMSKVGKEPYENGSVKAVVFDITLTRNYISFSSFFSGITTGY